MSDKLRAAFSGEAVPPEPTGPTARRRPRGGDEKHGLRDRGERGCVGVRVVDLLEQGYSLARSAQLAEVVSAVAPARR